MTTEIVPPGGVVIIGHGVWGHGATVQQAKQNFTNYGGRLSRGYQVFTFDDETTFRGVDNFGSVHYVGNPPTSTIAKPRKVTQNTGR